MSADERIKKRRRIDAIVGALIVVNVLACIAAPVSRWFTAGMFLLAAGWALSTAQMYWYRGEVYRYGGVPSDEQEPAERAS